MVIGQSPSILEVTTVPFVNPASIIFSLTICILSSELAVRELFVLLQENNNIENNSIKIFTAFITDNFIIFKIQQLCHFKIIIN